MIWLFCFNLFLCTLNFLPLHLRQWTSHKPIKVVENISTLLLGSFGSQTLKLNEHSFYFWCCWERMYTKRHSILYWNAWMKQKSKPNFMLAITSPLNICPESAQPITFFFYFIQCQAHDYILAARIHRRERERENGIVSLLLWAI